MITLPISALTLIIIILIAGPILCATTVILTHRVDSKLERIHLNERRANVASREIVVAARVEAVEGREWVAAEWEALLQERRLELSRQAHDFDDLVKAQIVLVEDDTTIMDIWKQDDLPTPTCAHPAYCAHPDKHNVRRGTSYDLPSAS